MLCLQMDYPGDRPRDEGLEQLLQVASEEGWKRCNSCHTMIERTFGSNRIT